MEANRGDLLVSVIMLTYNHEAYIKDAIYGVVQQKTDFRIELIVGDDASTDNTQRIVREMSDEYPDIIKPVLRETNIGALKNYRDLIKRSTGTYVAICDGDDYWTDPLKLQKQVDFLEANKDFVSCCHPVKQVYVDGSQEDVILDPLKLAGKDAESKGYLDIHDLIRMNTVASLSTIHRWSISRELPEWMEKYSVGDYPLLLFHADKGKVGVIPEVMGVYRKHNAGSWWNHTQTIKQKMDYISLLNDIDEELFLKYHDEFALIENYILEEIHRDDQKSNRGIVQRFKRICGKGYRFVFRRKIVISTLQKAIEEQNERTKRVEDTLRRLSEEEESVKKAIDRIQNQLIEEKKETERNTEDILRRISEAEENIKNTAEKVQSMLAEENERAQKVREAEAGIQRQLAEVITGNEIARQKIQLLWDGMRQIGSVIENGKPKAFIELLSYYFALGNFNEFYENYDVAFSNAEDIVSWINHVKTDFSMNVDLCIQNISQEELINLEKTFDFLEDEQSKDIYVRLIVWKILGFTKVKILPDEETQREKEIFSTLENSIVDSSIKIKEVKFELKCYDLGKLGFAIKCYAIPESIIMDFVRAQYENDYVRIEPGDYIIDCGACWGDTALLFASKCGKDGKVFSFEFVPSNIDVFNANVQLNPGLASSIVLAPYAVSDRDHDTIEFVDDGTATSIAIQKDWIESKKQTAKTITIDQYVREEQISRVDFIKMDIEGAETEALIGCKETIQHFRPKLAISIYHKKDDIWRIPQMIREMNPDYKFYIKHNSRSSLETILFAK